MPIGGWALPVCSTAKGRPELADHDARFAEGIGQHRVVARQRAQLCPRRLVNVAEGVRGDARRHPVGFRENDVERHHQCAHLGETRNNVGDACTRPRPLTDAVQALFVNIDNDDRPLRCIARMQHLKEIENADAELMQQDGVGQPKCRKPDEQQKSKPPGQTKSPRQSCKPLH